MLATLLETLFTRQVARRPVGLYVNEKCNVIVTCDRDNVVEEYTTSGLRVLRVSLEPSKLYHAVELSNGQYAVSHGQPVANVSVVNKEGRVMFAIKNAPASNVDEPRFLAVAENDGILVADRQRIRIVTLNSSLTCARDLPLPVFGGLTDPYCVYLDRARDRLYVGEYTGRRLLVFDNVTLQPCP